MGQTVLVIEDDPDTRSVVEFFLSKDGWQVEMASSGDEGLARYEELAPDVVVLDLSLPSVDGTEICRRIREDGTTPVIMLTGRQGEQDRLTGFDLGADDYLTKPFFPRELVARVRALWQRARPDVLDEEQQFSCGGLTIDLGKHEVTLEATPVPVTGTELRILALLAKNPGRVVSRQELLFHLYGNSYERDERTIEAHVSNLRRKLTAASGGVRYVHAVYGRGYKLSSER